MLFKNALNYCSIESDIPKGPSYAENGMLCTLSTFNSPLQLCASISSPFRVDVSVSLHTSPGPPPDPEHSLGTVRTLYCKFLSFDSFANLNTPSLLSVASFDCVIFNLSVVFPSRTCDVPDLLLGRSHGSDPIRWA
jgi:hypothetical protein